MSEELFKEMTESIIDGDADKSAELARKAIEQGLAREEFVPYEDE